MDVMFYINLGEDDKDIILIENSLYPDQDMNAMFFSLLKK